MKRFQDAARLPRVAAKMSKPVIGHVRVVRTCARKSECGHDEGGWEKLFVRRQSSVEICNAFKTDETICRIIR
jgi:hypothetical protein